MPELGHELGPPRACPFCGKRLQLYNFGRAPGTWFHPGVVTDNDCLFAGRGIRATQIDLWNMRADG